MRPPRRRPSRAHPARTWAQTHGHHLTEGERLPPDVLAAWRAAGSPGQRGPNPLRTRAAAAARLSPLDSGAADPWPRRCRDCARTSRKALDDWAATLDNAAAHGLPAPIPRAIARELYRTHPHLQAQLERIAAATDPAGCPGWLTESDCETGCRT